MTEGESRLQVKVVSLTIYDIPSVQSKRSLGSVCFAESFLDSTIQVFHPGMAVCLSLHFCQSIPTCLRPSVRPSVRPPARPPARLPARPPVRLSVCPSVCTITLALKMTEFVGVDSHDDHTGHIHSHFFYSYT